MSGLVRTVGGLGKAVLSVILIVAGYACSLEQAVAGGVVPDRFRFTDLDLRDPHVYIDFLGCRDATDTLLLDFSFNNVTQNAIQGDGDVNGYLDLSVLVEFLPLDQSLATNPMTIGAADCTAPMASTQCGALTSSQPAVATHDPDSICLGTLEGTLSSYTPSVATPGPACFVSSLLTLTVNVGGVLMSLSDAQVAASFDDDPATVLESGLIRGFMSETAANNTLLPNSLPLVGGQPLSTVLPGGSGSCAGHDARDVHNAVTGWWFYFNFSAAKLEPLPEEVFKDGFENSL
jgi:hypothetical protein